MKNFLKNIKLRYIFLILFLLSLILIFILYLPYRNQLKLQAQLNAKGIGYSTQPYPITESFQPLERVLGEEINGLEVTDVKEIPNPNKIPALVYLKIQKASEEDIVELAGHKNLKAIELTDYTGESLKPFSGISSLEHLIMTADNLKDVNELHKITNIQYLVIWADNVEDISSLSSLKNLNGLAFYSKSIKDYSPLFKLPKLEYLTLKDVITDETVAELVQNIPQLLKLDLESMKHPNDNVVYKSRRHRAMNPTTRTVYKKQK